MNKKHIHYDLIVAWASGEQIQFLNSFNEWEDIIFPSWYDDTTYRIKPKPHKHQECIDAYAQGKKIQCREPYSKEWKDVEIPCWFEWTEYRIKPEYKEVFLHIFYASRETDNWDYHVSDDHRYFMPNIKCTFDENYKLIGVEQLR